MSILVEFSIAIDRFELGGFIAQYDDLIAELERIVPTEDRVIPYVWVTGPTESIEALTETLEASDKTESVTCLDRLAVNGSNDRHCLYRIEWVLSDLDVVKGIVRANGSILEGECQDHYWHLRFRFRDHNDVADFYQYLADNNITDFSIDSIYELASRSERGLSYDISPDQREALILAAQKGYFETPREATLEEVGEELDITQQATSERVRRGVKNVVFDALNIPEPARRD